MAYFPFGMCSTVRIGEGFAGMKPILVVATIARQWRTQVLDEVELPPVPMSRAAGPVPAGSPSPVGEPHPVRRPPTPRERT
jgi:hypothetical protein